MHSTTLPPLLQGSVGILIFSIAVFLVAAYPTLLAAAAARAPAPSRGRRAAPWVVGGYLAIWLAAGLVAADGRSFTVVPDALRDVVGPAVGLAPMLAALVAIFASRTLGELDAAMEPQWLAFLQTYRVAGVMFLYPYLAYGVVPAGFAVPTALGDLVTGLAAPVVGLALARRSPGARGWAVAWNLFGVVDLILATVAAVLSGAHPFAIYPLALVPLFVGPPLGILTHVLSLRNLAIRARREPGAMALRQREALEIG